MTRDLSAVPFACHNNLYIKKLRWNIYLKFNIGFKWILVRGNDKVNHAWPVMPPAPFPQTAFLNGVENATCSYFYLIWKYVFNTLFCL